MTVDWTDSTCPVARAIDLFGDKWSLLIVRDAFDGVRRFSAFQRNLGIARGMLAARLRKLVDAGILETVPAADGGAYREYVLTDRGRALFAVIVSLRQWGERFAFAPGEAHSTLVERESGRRVAELAWRNAAGEAVEPDAVRVRKVEPE